MKSTIAIIMLLLSMQVLASPQDQMEKDLAVNVFNNNNSSKSDIAKSIIIFERFSKYDDLMLYYLGKANYDLSTDLITLNKEKGLRYIEKAAVKGLPLAQYEYAMILFKEAKNKEAIEFLTKAVKNNNSEAQYTLGKMYYLGEKVKRSKSTGFTLISTAAKNGNSNAQYDLAKIFFSQKEEDLQVNGIYWLTKAEKNGNLLACNDLYKIYFSGIIVERNLKKHVDYLECSAKNNNSEAKYLIATYYETGTYVQENHYKASYWFKSLAEDKDPLASVKYANFVFKYYNRDPQKVSEAIKFLGFVAETNADASMQLGYIYKNGLYNVDKDKTKAIKNFEIAKDLGNEDAQYMIMELLN